MNEKTIDNDQTNQNQMEISQDSAEETASLQFMCRFYNNCESTLITFLMNSLSEIVYEKCIRCNCLVLLYLHNAKDEFSINFIDFLKDPSVQELLNDLLFSIIAWDITSGEIKPILADKINECLGKPFGDFITCNKSAVLLIGNDEGKPHVLNIFQEPAELFNLHAQMHTYKNAYMDAENSDGDKLTPRNYLQLMLDQLGDRDYDCFEPNELDLLKKKIGFALFGPPKTEDGKYDEKQEEKIQRLCELIVKHNNLYSKWNGKVVISFIFICLEPLPNEKAKRANQYKKMNSDNCDAEYDPDTDYDIFPVFVLRKCKSQLAQHKNLCRVIIDKDERVYPTWESFLDNNKLPAGRMWYPVDGKYQTKECDNNILVEERLSPASKLISKVTGKMDTVLGIGGMVAGGVTMLAVAPAVILPAAAIGITSAVYATIRSVQTLTDRGKHKQVLTPADPESRAAYLNIAGGVLNVATIGSFRAVSYLAGRGVAFGQGARYVLFGLSGANLMVGGVGIGNSVYEMISRGVRPTPLQVAQLGASVFFFGNALYNFKSVNLVIEEGQVKALAKIENNLRSNRLRRTFRRLVGETMRNEGSVRGKAEVIASVRKMDDVNCVMAALTRSQKLFSNANVRYSVRNGNVVLNGTTVNIVELGGMPSVDRGAFLQTLPPIPENLTPAVRATIVNQVNAYFADRALHALFRLTSCTSTDRLVTEVLSAFEAPVRDFILGFVKRFLESLADNVVTKLRDMFGDGNVGVKVVRWLVMELKDTNLFKKVLNKTISDGELERLYDDIKKRFFRWFTILIFDEAEKEKRKKLRREDNVYKIKKGCPDCDGYYYISP